MVNAFVERRVDQAAHVVHLVRIERLGERRLLERRARADAVVAHDLRVRPEEQAVVGEELVEQRLLVSHWRLVMVMLSHPVC